MGLHEPEEHEDEGGGADPEDGGQDQHQGDEGNGAGPRGLSVQRTKLLLRHVVNLTTLQSSREILLYLLLLL